MGKLSNEQTKPVKKFEPLKNMFIELLCFAVAIVIATFFEELEQREMKQLKHKNADLTTQAAASEEELCAELEQLKRENAALVVQAAASEEELCDTKNRLHFIQNRDVEGKLEVLQVKFAQLKRENSDVIEQLAESRMRVSAALKRVHENESEVFEVAMLCDVAEARICWLEDRASEYVKELAIARAATASAELKFAATQELYEMSSKTGVALARKLEGAMMQIRLQNNN